MCLWKLFVAHCRSRSNCGGPPRRLSGVSCYSLEWRRIQLIASSTGRRGYFIKPTTRNALYKTKFDSNHHSIGSSPAFSWRLSAERLQKIIRNGEAVMHSFSVLTLSYIIQPLSMTLRCNASAFIRYHSATDRLSPDCQRHHAVW